MDYSKRFGGCLADMIINNNQAKNHEAMFHSIALGYKLGIGTILSAEGKWKEIEGIYSHSLKNERVPTVLMRIIGNAD